MINYFAFGHNTNFSEFKRRIPTAKLLGTGTLFGWKLEFKHFANIICNSISSVQGVVYSIPSNQLKVLDKDEDYLKHYDRTRVVINLHGKNIHAFTYVMINSYEHSKLPTYKLLPSPKYIHWVAQGYREHHIGLSQLITALETRIAEERYR